MKKILNQLHSHILLVCYPHTLCPYLFIAAPHPPPLSPTCTYCALSTLLGLRCTVLHYSASPRLTSFFHTLSTIQLHTTPLSTSPSPVPLSLSHHHPYSLYSSLPLSLDYNEIPTGIYPGPSPDSHRIAFRFFFFLFQIATKNSCGLKTALYRILLIEKFLRLFIIFKGLINIGRKAQFIVLIPIGVLRINQQYILNERRIVSLS